MEPDLNLSNVKKMSLGFSMGKKSLTVHNHHQSIYIKCVNLDKIQLKFEFTHIFM